MVKKLFPTVILILIAGYAWAQNFEKGKSLLTAAEVELKVPEPGYGMVYVIRPIGIQPEIQFFVYLDETNKDHLIGHTTGGQHLYFQVTPGEHVIYSSGKNIKYIKINIKDGETVFIKQTVHLDSKSMNNQGDLEIIPKIAADLQLKRSSSGTYVEQR